MNFKNIILVIVGCFYTTLFFALVYVGVKNISEGRDIGLVQFGLSFFFMVTISECIKDLIKEKGDE
jgi:hypothetical protein